RVAAASAKPDLPLVLVDAIDAADDEFPLRNLIFDRAFLGVDQIQVPPAVALRSVDQVVGLFEPIDELQANGLCVGGPNERFAFLVYKIAAAAGARVDFDEPQSLMTAIDLLIREGAAVFVPANAGRAEADA